MKLQLCDASASAVALPVVIDVDATVPPLLRSLLI